MLRKKSLKNHCRSNLASSQLHAAKPTFRTLYKCRNDSLAVSQLYQDLPTSQSQTNIMAQSYPGFSSEEPRDKPNL